MTNETNYTPKVYAGNGTTKTFSFNWKVLDEDDIVVQLVNTSTGVGTIQTLGHHYNANVESVGGSITFITAPASGYNVVISRVTSQYQSSTYSTSTGFQGSEIEKSFDKVSLNLQEMQYKNDEFHDTFTEEIRGDLDRALKVPVGSSETPDELMNHLLTAEQTAGSYATQAQTSASTASEMAATATAQATIATQQNQSVQATYTNAISTINSAKTSALDTINASCTSALSSISSAQTTAVNAVSSKQTTAVNTITALQTTAVNTISALKTNAISTITNTSESAVASCNEAAYNASLTAENTTAEISTSYNSAILNLNNAKNNALSAVQNAEQAAIGNILSDTTYIIIRDWED